MSTPTALHTATAALTGVDWAAVGGGDLLAASVALGRLKAVVDGALVCVAERLEETRGAEAIGWASTKDLLTHLTGGRKGRRRCPGPGRPAHRRPARGPCRVECWC